MPIVDDAHATLAGLLEALTAQVPERIAIVQGSRRVSWGEFDAHAAGLAAAFLDAGLDRGDRVALYLHNCPEYLEAFVGACKSSLVPVNTNYRYVDDELVHLWRDADAAVVVFHGAFTTVVERVRDRADFVRAWFWVDDGEGTCPTWAVPYVEAVATPPRTAPWARSRDDRFFIYTGGTTGLPKGVMWDQTFYLGLVPADTPTVEEHARRRRDATVRIGLTAAPLMHGTGCAAAIGTLIEGGTVVLLPAGRFDPWATWDLVDRERVGSIALVGDAFARPLADALDEETHHWDLTCMRGIMSAGVMFSTPVKDRLLAHMPQLTILDRFGSSENGYGGTSVSRAGVVAETATFQPMPGVRVIDDDGLDVEAGSGTVGVLAIPGGALGYHKDAEKSDRTWKTIDGTRYTIAGDFATVLDDGTVKLLGRGSVCVNTGGEKVYPEEVEEVLKTHAAVRDAVVVGIPNERFGEALAAVVELDRPVADDELRSHAGDRLASYKVPRHVLRVPDVGRAPNGKADYAAARRRMLEAVASGVV